MQLSLKGQLNFFSVPWLLIQAGRLKHSTLRPSCLPLLSISEAYLLIAHPQLTLPLPAFFVQPLPGLSDLFSMEAARDFLPIEFHLFPVYTRITYFYISRQPKPVYHGFVFTHSPPLIITLNLYVQCFPLMVFIIQPWFFLTSDLKFSTALEKQKLHL